MFTRRFKLFTFLGFRVSIDLSWLIIAGLVIWSLAAYGFPTWYPQLQPWVYVAMGAAAAVGLFLSIVIHEFSHSLIARRFGMEMKGITLFVFGGVAEMGEDSPSPKAEISMAIAGPISSLILAGIFAGLWLAGMAWGWPVPVYGLMMWIAWLNVALAIFNMIPAFPLDGGRVLRGILWAIKKDLAWATQWSSRAGEGLGWLLMGGGFVAILMGAFIMGLWWIFIGMFIKAAARQGYQQVLVRRALSGERVGDLMTRSPVTVTPDITVDELVSDYVYEYHYKFFPVVTNGDLRGCVSTRQIREIPRERWGEYRVEDIATSCGEDNTVTSDTDAMDALQKMQKTQASRLMVVDQGRHLEGILALKDLMRHLSLRMELDAGPGRVPRSLRDAPNAPELPTPDRDEG